MSVTGGSNRRPVCCLSTVGCPPADRQSDSVCDRHTPVADGCVAGLVCCCLLQTRRLSGLLTSACPQPSQPVCKAVWAICECRGEGGGMVWLHSMSERVIRHRQPGERSRSSLARESSRPPAGPHVATTLFDDHLRPHRLTKSLACSSTTASIVDRGTDRDGCQIIDRRRRERSLQPIG